MATYNVRGSSTTIGGHMTIHMYMGSGNQVKVIKSDNIALTPLPGTTIKWEGESLLFAATHVMVIEMDKSIQSFAWSKDWGKWVEDPFLTYPLLYIYNSIVE